MAFDASGITTGNTRTLTIPDSDGTLIISLGGIIDVASNVIKSTTSDIVLTPVSGSNVLISGAGTTEDIGLVVQNPSTTNTYASYLQLIVDSDNRTAGGSWKVSLTEVDHNLVFWNDDTTPDTFVSKFSLTPLGSAFFTSIVTATSGFSVSNNEIFTGTTTNSLLHLKLDNASASGTLAYFQNDGSGTGIHIVNNGVGSAITLVGGVGSAITATSSGVTATGAILNATCNSLTSGKAVSITSSSLEGGNLGVFNVTGASFTGAILSLAITNAAATGDGINIVNEGLGGSIYFAAGKQNLEFQAPASNTEYACVYTERVTISEDAVFGDVLNYDGTDYSFANATVIGSCDSLVICLETVNGDPTPTTGLVAHISAGGILYGTNIGGVETTGNMYLTTTATTTNTIDATPPSGTANFVVTKIGYKRGANVLVLDNAAWTELTA